MIFTLIRLAVKYGPIIKAILAALRKDEDYLDWLHRRDSMPDDDARDFFDLTKKHDYYKGRHGSTDDDYRPLKW